MYHLKMSCVFWNYESAHDIEIKHAYEKGVATSASLKHKLT